MNYATRTPDYPTDNLFHSFLTLRLKKSQTSQRLAHSLCPNGTNLDTSENFLILISGFKIQTCITRGFGVLGYSYETTY